MSYQGKDNAHTEEKAGRSKLHYKIILPGELELKLTDSCALTMAISIGFALYKLTYIAIKLPDCQIVDLIITLIGQKRAHWC